MPGHYGAQNNPGVPPGVPTGLSLVGGNAQMTASWTAPTQVGSAPIQTYNVAVYKAGVYQSESSFNDSVTSVTLNSSNYPDGIDNGVSYTVEVSAASEAGGSAWSAQSNAVTPSAGGYYSPLNPARSGYTLVADFQFTNYTSTSEMPTAGIWVNSPAFQTEDDTSMANVAVGPGGLTLEIVGSNNGANIDTDPATDSPGSGTANPGLAVQIPLYRQVICIFPTAPNGKNSNHMGPWMLGTANSSGESGQREWEVDVAEVLSIDGDGNTYEDGIVMGHLHTGLNSVNQSPKGVRFGVLSGEHTIGVLVTQTSATYDLDGTQFSSATSESYNGEANPLTWAGAGGTPPSTLQLYLMLLAGDGSYGGQVVYGQKFTVLRDTVWQVPA